MTKKTDLAVLDSGQTAGNGRLRQKGRNGSFQKQFRTTLKVATWNIRSLVENVGDTWVVGKDECHKIELEIGTKGW
jgi:hypothetical protein